MAEPKDNEFLDDLAEAEAEEFAQSLDEFIELLTIDEFLKEQVHVILPNFSEQVRWNMSGYLIELNIDVVFFLILISVHSE